MSANECFRDEQLQGQSRKLEALETRVNYKEEAIREIKEDMKELKKSMEALDKSINDFILKSVNDDNEIRKLINAQDNRITALESSQDTIYRLLSVVTVIFVILTFYFNFIR